MESGELHGEGARGAAAPYRDRNRGQRDEMPTPHACGGVARPRSVGGAAVSCLVCANLCARPVESVESTDCGLEISLELRALGAIV